MHTHLMKMLAILLTAATSLITIPVKGALQFDGVDDHVVVKRDLSGGLDAITVCGWVWGEQQSNIINFSSCVVLLHFASGVGFYLIGTDEKPSNYLNWRPGPNPGKWQFLAATWSNAANGDGKMRLYLNGVKQQEDLAYAGGSGGVLKSSSAMLLGHKFNQGILPFKGLMEDVRVYNRALSPDEILKINNSAGYDGVADGLKLRWLLNEKEKGQSADGDNTIIDASGNGNHGTPMGAPLYWTAPAAELANCAKARERMAACFKDSDAKMTAPFKPRYEELCQLLDKLSADHLSRAGSLLQQFNTLETELNFEILLAE